MNPGRLRHRVTIESSAVSTPDGLGGGTRTTSTVATVWARVEPLRGDERQIAAALRGQVTHRVTIRYRADVTASMRLVWQGHTLAIREVKQPDAISRWLELYCLEGE